MSVKPIVAIVGRPNVGKSRLFNRLLRRPRSIVADEPGVTRDRIYADATLTGDEGDRDVVLVDTGGFDPQSENPIMKRVLEQTQLAIDEADVVVHLTDGRVGLAPEDRDIANLLRRAGKKVILAVNKLDGHKQDDLLHEFHELGVLRTIPVSAAHGRNATALEELIVELLPDRAEDVSAIDEPPEEGAGPDEAKPPIRVAVIGRPNSGKSSLINRLLGEDRHVVSEVAGTTVDTVDSLVEWREQKFLFIDTAGIRRKRSIALRVERFSVVAALKGLERSDVALLLLDSTEDVAQQDAKVSSFAFERGKAVILVMSKWDLKQGEEKKAEAKKRLREQIPHLAYAPVVFTSAHTGSGMSELMPSIQKVHEEYAQRIPTGQLNRFVEEVMDRNPPPAKKAKRGKIYFITQIGVRPPRFLVSVNDPELIHFSYRRYLVNEIRKRYGFSGVPLLVGYRSHKSADDAVAEPIRRTTVGRSKRLPPTRGAKKRAGRR
jgi:GTP-binding protein